jgi:hypothetical protein
LLLLATPAAAQQTVTIDQNACRVATRHVPAADVEYKPGRDVVNGKPVAPADLSPQIQLPQRFSVVVAVDVAKKLQNLQQQQAGLGTTAATQNPNSYGLPPGGEAKAYLGQIDVDLASNRLTFNGQPLTDDLESDLAAACRNWRPGR